MKKYRSQIDDEICKAKTNLSSSKLEQDILLELADGEIIRLELLTNIYRYSTLKMIKILGFENTDYNSCVAFVSNALSRLAVKEKGNNEREVYTTCTLVDTWSNKRILRTFKNRLSIA